MFGLMNRDPLLISSTIEHAGRVFRDHEVVSRMVDGALHRHTYAQLRLRSLKLARALSVADVEIGDRVSTLAWNTHRHLEIYFGVSGMGAVCHTVNPRLHPTQMTWIINHAAPKVIFADSDLYPLVEKIRADLTSQPRLVPLDDTYESLIEPHEADFEWPTLDEEAAASLCYTSGTTGDPKGVLYSHRSTILHSFGISLPDAFAFGMNEVILPVVPMFHVNAWGIPYAAAMTGTKMVMPGPRLDGRSLFELMDTEGVTISAGVPTVWHALLTEMKKQGRKPGCLNRLIIGGSAAPAAMIRAFEDDFGIAVRHAWGMTEMSPLGSVCLLKPKLQELPETERMGIKTKQGLAPFGVQMRIVDDAGTELPRDGKAFGELQVKGPWVCREYYRLEDSVAHGQDGWFSTGDVATIDEHEYMHIVDRSKDVIKSGGEWISTIELENEACNHPAILQAAVVAVPHPKWDERPLLVAVKQEGAEVTADEVRGFLADKVAKWWLPDDVVFVDALPLGATGKVLKTKLRAQYAKHVLPER